VELGARSFDILIALLSRPNEVVSKRDLLAQAWPGVTVEEGSLRFHIAGLRKALGDGNNGARYIMTLTGRGYCFVAPISIRRRRRNGNTTPASDFPQADAPSSFVRMLERADDVLALSTRLAAEPATPFDMSAFPERPSGLLPAPPEEASILGVSAAMRAVERTLKRIARVPTTVLLTGETGVGKEVCARFLHQAGGAGGPFIAVNCAAIPAELLEGELFGHERGAFTGAQNRHLGYAERARDGTLFLDEIGDLAVPLQAKILRLLEDRQFFRVGGETPVPFRARVVCATDMDLERQVRERTFREDLFYRINVVPVAVPPLRDRPEDTAWLLERFFDAFNGQFQANLSGISSLAEDAAVAHAWPGNVRELRNRIERGVALALGPYLMPGDLFGEAPDKLADAPLASLEEARMAAERRHIRRALELAGGEIGQAARLLGISRTTLWEKMRRLRIGGDGV